MFETSQHIHTHAHTHTCQHTHAHLRTYTRTLAHIRAQLRTHAHTSQHARHLCCTLQYSKSKVEARWPLSRHVALMGCGFHGLHGVRPSRRLQFCSLDRRQSQLDPAIMSGFIAFLAFVVVVMALFLGGTSSSWPLSCSWPPWPSWPSSPHFSKYSVHLSSVRPTAWHVHGTPFSSVHFVRQVFFHILLRPPLPFASVHFSALRLSVPSSPWLAPPSSWT